MTKAIRMTITSTIEVTAPLDADEQHLTVLTDQHRDTIRRSVKSKAIAQAKTDGSKVRNIVVAKITLVDVP